VVLVIPVFEMEMGERISRHGERRAVVTVAVLKGLKKQELLIQYCRQYFRHYYELQEQQIQAMCTGASLLCLIAFCCFFGLRLALGDADLCFSLISL